jgi:hypothetical protein
LVDSDTFSPKPTDEDETVEPYLAGAPPAVPWTGPDVEPGAAESVRADGARVRPILAGQHQRQPCSPASPNDEDRTVFTLAGVVLEGDPGPTDLADVRSPVAARCVFEGVGSAPTPPLKQSPHGSTVVLGVGADVESIRIETG